MPKSSLNKVTKRGRRTGESGTRQAILELARTRFAQDGYAGTTIRKVAADAGVDPALVIQYFRSKEDLFGEVMFISQKTLSRIANSVIGPPEMLGQRVTNTLIDLWEGPPEESEPLQAMIRSAVSNENVSTQLRDFIQARLVEVICPNMPDIEEATQRAGLAVSMLIGIIIVRTIIGVPTLTDMDRETVVRLVEGSIQQMLTD